MTRTIKQATYIITGQFERSRTKNDERWKGQAKNMPTATRKAISQIMRRPSVKRLRHKRVTFTVERAEE